jgi:hypothetical protein
MDSTASASEALPTTQIIVVSARLLTDLVCYYLVEIDSRVGGRGDRDRRLLGAGTDWISLSLASVVVATAAVTVCIFYSSLLRGGCDVRTPPDSIP